jgi:hypothetical protein
MAGPAQVDRDRSEYEEKMMRVLATILVLVASAASFAGDKNDTLEQLKAKAESAEGKHQVELLIEIAERQSKAADELFSAGNLEQGHAAIDDVANYGVRAAKQATNSGKRMKQTEIALRKIADRLDTISKAVEVDERPPVKEAIRKLEAARNDLLFRMFK